MSMGYWGLYQVQPAKILHGKWFAPDFIGVYSGDSIITAVPFFNTKKLERGSWTDCQEIREQEA